MTTLQGYTKYEDSESYKNYKKGMKRIENPLDRIMKKGEELERGGKKEGTVVSVIVVVLSLLVFFCAAILYMVWNGVNPWGFDIASFINNHSLLLGFVPLLFLMFVIALISKYPSQFPNLTKGCRYNCCKSSWEEDFWRSSDQDLDDFASKIGPYSHLRDDY